MFAKQFGKYGFFSQGKNPFAGRLDILNGVKGVVIKGGNGRQYMFKVFSFNNGEQDFYLFYLVDQVFLVTVKPAAVKIHTMKTLLNKENTRT